MQRDTLRRAISRVVLDLRETGMGEMFAAAFERARPSKDEARQQWLDFEVYQNFIVRAHNYSEVERRILIIMDLEGLLDPEFWQTLVSNADRSAFFTISQTIRFAMNHLPRVIALLDRDYPTLEDFQEGHRPREYTDKDIIRLVLSEEQQQFSSTERLILALTAIQSIYDIVHEVNRMSPDKLLVLGIDSGSEKLFDLLGIASAVAETKELILGLFDRLVFFKNISASKNIGTIAESLPVFGKIAELETSKAISPQEAELLRRKLANSIENFVNSGALIPEMRDTVIADPMVIMRPQPKLLSAPTDIGAPASASQEEVSMEDDANGTPLTPGEKQELEKLLRKAGYAPSSARRARTPARKPKK